jgi:hypothetical protein
MQVQGDCLQNWQSGECEALLIQRTPRRYSITINLPTDLCDPCLAVTCTSTWSTTAFSLQISIYLIDHASHTNFGISPYIIIIIIEVTVLTISIIRYQPSLRESTVSVHDESNDYLEA